MLVHLDSSWNVIFLVLFRASKGNRRIHIQGEGVVPGDAKSSVSVIPITSVPDTFLP